MQKVESVFGFYGTWKTEKTVTSEFVFFSVNGAQSIRIVRSANGHKVNVYSGFDVLEFASWDAGNDDEMPTMPTARHELWEHRYLESIQKACGKWGGMWDSIGHARKPGELLEAAQTLWAGDQTVQDVDTLREALRSQEDVLMHFEMLMGKREGESSGKKAADKDQAKRQVQRQAVQSLAERYAHDPEFGIF